MYFCFPLIPVLAALLIESWIVSALISKPYRQTLLTGIVFSAPLWVPLLALGRINPHREPFAILGAWAFVVVRAGYVLRHRGWLRWTGRGGRARALVGLACVPAGVVLALPANGPAISPTLAFITLALLATAAGRGDRGELLCRAGWAFLPSILCSLGWGVKYLLILLRSTDYSLPPDALLTTYWTMTEEKLPLGLTALSVSGPILLGYQIYDMGFKVRFPNTSLFLVALSLMSMANGVLDRSVIISHLQPMDVGRDPQTAITLLWIPPDSEQEALQQIIYDQIPIRSLHEFKIEKPEGTFRIIAVGGSATRGDCGLDEEQAWPIQVQRILGRSGRDDVEVLNAGVSGYGSFNIYLLIKHLLIHYDPDMIIAYVGFNDAFHVPLIRSQWDGLQRRWNLSQVSDPHRALGRSALVQGVSRVVEGVRFHRDLMQFRHETPEDYYLNLQDIRQFCEEHGIRFVLVSEPYMNEYPPLPHPIDATTVRFAAENQVNFLDLKEWFDERGLQFHDQYFVDAVHHNLAGSKLTASLIVEYLLKQGLLDKSP